MSRAERLLGIERYPSPVTRRMSKKRVAKVSKVKPFIKIINYNHLLPTRYTLELEGLKGVVSNDTFKEQSNREEAKKVVKRTLEERCKSISCCFNSICSHRQLTLFNIF